MQRMGLFPACASVYRAPITSCGWGCTRAGIDGGRCSRVRSKLFVELAQTLVRLGVRYTWPEMRERYVAGPPSSEAAAKAQAVLAATTGADPAVDDLKMKLM
jgi:hypothetical protein